MAMQHNHYALCTINGTTFYSAGASFTKQLSKNLGLSFFLSEKFPLIPYHKILSLNLRYFMKLAPGHFNGPKFLYC